MPVTLLEALVSLVALASFGVMAALSVAVTLSVALALTEAMGALLRRAAFLAARLLAVARTGGATHGAVADAVLAAALRPCIPRERATELRRASRLANRKGRRLTRRYLAHRPRQLRANQGAAMQRFPLASGGLVRAIVV